jgi:hypothetical protein
LNAIYVRKKNELGQWRYQRVNTGRGRRPTAFQGPFFSRVKEAGSKWQSWVSLGNTIKEAVQVADTFSKRPVPRPRKSVACRRSSRSNVPIYFIQATESRRIKIGIANDVDARFRNLQTSCPEKLEILAVLAPGLTSEKQLHELFANTRKIGEWFESSPELETFISEHREKVMTDIRRLFEREKQRRQNERAA